jgi:hypothetical protein
LGYRNELGTATQEMCFPSKENVIKQVKLAVKEYSAKSVFVSSDHDHMIPELTKALKRMEVRFFLFFAFLRSIYLHTFLLCAGIGAQIT